MSDPANINLKELLTAACEGVLTPEQYAQLDQLIRNDPAARLAYLRHTQLEANLQRLLRPGASASSLSDTHGILQALAAVTDSDRLAPSLHDTMVTPAIHAEVVEQPQPAQRPPSLWRTTPAKTPLSNQDASSFQRFPAWAAIITISFLVLVLILVNRPHSHTIAVLPTAPVSPPVMPVKLTQALNARWEGASPAPTVGSQFPDQTQLRLTSGYAEFAFASGSEMVLQAPADIEILSDNSVFLRSGKLSARVPAQAVGFSVSTGQSTITDLGTEFGVSANPSGTEVDVFKGKVAAQTPSTQPALLTANDAASIDQSGQLNLNRGGAVPQRFVRQLWTNAPFLDLVDLAAGGDGTTSRRGPAIDARTGQYGQLAPTCDAPGTPGYHPVPLPVIDGCFVPNVGATQIDSARHYFTFTGATGITFNNILTGDKTIWPDKWDSNTPLSPLSCQLGGVDYSQLPHDFLMLHPSSGLTFDLSAIAALHPGNRMMAFHSLVGNSCQIATRVGGISNPANIYVFVDGVMRFQDLGLTNKTIPVVVDLPLNKTDHFLTLATSQASRTIGWDWIIFADPHINLSAPSRAGGTQ